MAFIVVTGGEAFMPSGMTKNGALKMTASWADVTGWTADTSGYPGSELSGNGLRVQGGKVAATVTVNLPFSGGNGSPKQTARIQVNGNTVATGTQVTGVAGTLTASATTDLVAGDVISVQVICDVFSGWETTITTGAGTYVRIT
ncbi:hypothetical protein [Nocardia thailandica]|uniref:hypothetical protein n=1 Tax=Nocardia thailandica TaxID=257275 RepID=UPI0002DEE3BE|nr:hypothetical protein [Nocardia thailandica]